MNNEPTILNHYNLTAAFPTAWPTAKDDSESEEEKAGKDSRAGVRRSKSRYSALERSGSDRRSLVPGSEKLKDGQENLVQKDESDPLGGSNSVVRALRHKGLPVEEDQRLRNRFLLSSTTFSPNLYLSQVHSNASAQDLLHGLEFLSRSIDQKSASLKVLVESNFERFVRAKTTIDNVYAEMRSQGAELEPDRPLSHARVTSKGSSHFRNISGHGSPNLSKGVSQAASREKRKNALTKDSDYGVQGIRTPLLEVAVKTEEIWGPALGGRERESSLKLVIDSVENSQGIFRVTKVLSDCIKRKDYEGLIEEYAQARKFTEEARLIAENASNNHLNLTDPQIHKIVITGRMWTEVEGRIGDFKRDLWRKLASIQTSTAPSTGPNSGEEHMALISVLLELGVDDNPIWVYLLSRYDHLKNKITATFERSRVEIEVLRRRLANNEAPAAQVVAGYLKSVSSKDTNDKIKSLDTVPVIELWDLIYNSMLNLLSAQHGILGEVMEFWDKAQMFIDGKVQKTLPIGVDGQSRKHHRLSTDGVHDLQNGAVELIEMLQGFVLSFFTDPPIEDISMLFSPVPNTPITPQSAVISPHAHQDTRFKFDKNHPPPPTPRRGDAWEEFAFWPPHSNAISGVHYLEKLLTLIGSAASEMVTVKVSSRQTTSDKLKVMISSARERSVKAACAAWSRDAEMCKYLEDWSRTNEQRDITNMPSRFSAFESTVLSGMQKIMYIPEAANTKPGSASIVSPPPAKLVHMVRSQFVTSLYKALSGMVENAERSKPPDPANDVAGLDDSIAFKDAEGNIEGDSRNICMLLTLSNLRLLQTDSIPQLISQFETHFSITLTEESKTVRDVLYQISDRIFVSYIVPTAKKLSSVVHDGIASPDWMPASSRSMEVRPYVYEALLLLVYVHTEVSTTATSLTHQIISNLLERMSEAFLHAFQERPRYPLTGLLQATLDVEFVAQTMTQYTTKKAGETQSQIYVELDSKTTQAASKQLQGELPEMRLVLKRLREATRIQFLCFKKERGRAPTQT